jgi:hypothetical protein
MSFNWPLQAPHQEGISGFERYQQSLPRRDGAVETAAMRKIGSGGSHDVLVGAPTDAYVLKVDRALVARTAKLAEVTPGMRVSGERVVSEKRKGHAGLCEAFGKEHCLEEEYFLDKIYSETENRPIDTILTVQEKSDIFENPTKTDFSASYIDKDARKIDEAEYAKLIGIAEGRDFDEAVFLKHEKKFAAFLRKSRAMKHLQKPSRILSSVSVNTTLKTSGFLIFAGRRMFCSTRKTASGNTSSEPFSKIMERPENLTLR